MCLQNRKEVERIQENDVESKPQEEILTASYHGEKCRHNGENPDYEMACDECDYYLLCFPDWEEFI